MKEDKILSIISYIALLGLIVAFIANTNKKYNSVSFHIRQSLGINILYFISYLIGLITNCEVLYYLLILVIFVAWLYGFIGAIQDEEKEIPYLGKYFQDWFSFIQ